jgi:hypothetical protein
MPSAAWRANVLHRREEFMGLTGVCRVGHYEGHNIELVRNNWNKTLKLLIDGQEVARESCRFPGARTLIGSLDHGRVRHLVVASSVPDRLVRTKETISVDGADLQLTSQKPRGLLIAVCKDARTGHLSSVIVVVAMVFGILVFLAVAAGLVRAWWR